ncbi:hypothetical protein [Phreatobacter stygius]|uniref:Uncharacterized protein n=1 Tax=Phreatobacter stygius TaxID=1940610 RepID=A0A4D7BLB9_9HYPH|nr:hypothetical protein [Phreatobacter stygius]QCI68522.1 hypothetical protein E8M01_32420 [Phreatobacter stygius]
MNTANLQLEGLCMAVAALTRLLVQKGVVTADEVDLALHRAEANLTSEDRQAEDMSPANRNAVVFPLRLLRLANRRLNQPEPSFAELAVLVGETKRPYNDQM